MDRKLIVLLLVMATSSIIGLTTNEEWYGIATFLGLSAIIVGRGLG